MKQIVRLYFVQYRQPLDAKKLNGTMNRFMNQAWSQGSYSEDCCQLHAVQTGTGVRFRRCRLCLVSMVTFDEPFSRN